MAGWESRIVGHESRKVSELTANPANWRKHPKGQAKALEAMLKTVGFAKSITVNVTTGNMVDGHLRLELAKERNEEALDCELVELSEEEERIVLATLDPIGALAGTDRGVYAELMKSLEPTDQDVKKFLAGIAKDYALDMVPAPTTSTTTAPPTETPQGMRMMQLMFTLEEHDRLVKALAGLKTAWGTETDTATITRAIQESA